MKVLITGGSGLVGMALARRLVQVGDTVVILDRISRPMQFVDSESTAVISLEGDMTNPEFLADVFARERPDTVVHLASILGGECSVNPRACAEVNCMGTLSLLENCEQFDIRRVVIASSEAVYGPDRTVVSDPRAVAPDRPDYPFDGAKLYAMSKLFAEALSEQFAERGLSTCGLRLAMVIGPGRRRTTANTTLSESQISGTVTAMIEGAAQGQPLTVSLRLEDEIAYLYVDDVAAQLDALCRAPEAAFRKRRFFHTGADAVTLGHVVDELRLVAPDAPLIVRPINEQTATEPRILSRTLMSDVPLRDAVGVSRSFPLRQGIAAHIEATKALAAAGPE